MQGNISRDHSAEALYRHGGMKRQKQRQKHLPRMEAEAEPRINTEFHGNKQKPRKAE